MTAHHTFQPSVYGTGLIALDIVICADESQPIRSWAGGTCGNVLTIMSFLGWGAYPIARLNGDVASIQVKGDFSRWGVHLDFAECSPTSATPIVIQEIKRDNNGTPKHRFAWSCPHCGSWLPGYRPVTARNMTWVLPSIQWPTVFFMDRLSRAALTLASHSAEKGALVVFEPSAKMDVKLLSEALKVAHVVKYANQRILALKGVNDNDSTVQLEIQTLGAEGLRFRSRLPKAKIKKWMHLPALPAPVLADTCGAGDWCTAGLISKIGAKGLQGFQQLSENELYNAIRHGQAFAAWTCGFEGARGGMYQMDKKQFSKQINLILKGKSIKNCTTRLRENSFTKESVYCPVCLG